jgi:predicted membrane chloride channel (bestrophin family)
MHFQIEFNKNVKKIIRFVNKWLQMTSIWVGSNTKPISKKCITHYLFALVVGQLSQINDPLANKINLFEDLL